MEVLARYGGSTYLAGMPAVVRRAGLAYVGCSSVEAWTDILARILVERGLAVMPARAGVERFARGDRVVTLDHASLAISGLNLPA